MTDLCYYSSSSTVSCLKTWGGISESVNLFQLHRWVVSVTVLILMCPNTFKVWAYLKRASLCVLCVVTVSALKLKSNVCIWISLSSNHLASNLLVVLKWDVLIVVSGSVFIVSHGGCIHLIKSIQYVYCWQVIKNVESDDMSTKLNSLFWLLWWQMHVQDEDGKDLKRLISPLSSSSANSSIQNIQKAASHFKFINQLYRFESGPSVFWSSSPCQIKKATAVIPCLFFFVWTDLLQIKQQERLFTVTILLKHSTKPNHLCLQTLDDQTTLSGGWYSG